jgi:hypothetical protein
MLALVAVVVVQAAEVQEQVMVLLVQEAAELQGKEIVEEMEMVLGQATVTVAAAVALVRQAEVHQAVMAVIVTQVGALRLAQGKT